MEKSNFIFESFGDWRKFFVSSVRQFFVGMFRIIYAVIMAVVSLLVYAGKQIEAFCKRETTASFIIACVILFMAVGWISTFTHGRHEAVLAQHKADSISYQLDRYMQAYDSTATVVVNGDTVKYGR